MLGMSVRSTVWQLGGAVEYSVSVVCLNQQALEDNVRQLLRYPVSDLHCDYFPEVATARSLSLGQIEWCQRHWPRDLTIHVWGADGVRDLAKLAPRGRVLVQVHGAGPAHLRPCVAARRAGWRTGVSLSPDLVGPVMGRLDLSPVAVQVLSTSTPGFVGGSLLATTWPAVTDLHGLRAARGADWTIEVDGGLTEVAVQRLADLCDLGVLGSNSLRTDPATGHRFPSGLLEKAGTSRRLDDNSKGSVVVGREGSFDR
jgi:pentose-5-phosphate-3-epimerase